MSYIEDYLPIGEGFEGRVEWMYLDSKGNVTVGVGELLANVSEALAIPFRSPDGKRDATADEIAANFRFVKASHVGFKAGYYRLENSLILEQVAIDALFRAKVLDFDDQLRADFAGYDAFPDAVKMALLDMEYNLGDTRLRGTYPHFDAAVDACDWLTAAAQCGRDAGDPAFAARNDWTKGQFVSALG